MLSSAHDLHQPQKWPKLPIPKTGILKNKSRIRGIFFNPKIRPSIHHETTTIHHTFTIKKPHPNTRFPQPPLQKHRNHPPKKSPQFLTPTLHSGRRFSHVDSDALLGYTLKLIHSRCPRHRCLGLPLHKEAYQDLGLENMDM
jgi:hypothetical protein